MVATINQASILAERRQSALQRLARQYPQFSAEADPVSGGYIVRNAKVPGRVTLVSAAGVCSCNYGRLFDVCRHTAAVARLEVVEADTSWHILPGGKR